LPAAGGGHYGLKSSLIKPVKALAKNFAKKPGRHPARALSLLFELDSVNGTNQIIADASDNDNCRHGPQQKYWHVRLLQLALGE
jgi:hypothetical protein